MGLSFWFATIVFVATYALIASEKVHKTTAALIGASLMLLVILEGPGHGKHGSKEEQLLDLSLGDVIQNLTFEPEIKDAHLERYETEKERSQRYQKLDVYARNVNFNVVFTLIGMMLLVNILSKTGLFQFVAIKCAKFARGSPIRTLVLLVFASAFLSAFLDNVTTVLLMAPVTLLVAAELGVPAIPFLLAETFAANIGGTATLIGDPPNLIIGSVAHLDFASFMINLAPFVVAILVAYAFALKLYYGKRMEVTVERRARIMELDERAAITDPGNMRRGGIVMLLTVVGFLVHGAIGLQPSVVAMTGAAVALALCRVDVDEALEKVEWGTIFFFIGLFIVVSGADHVGLMDRLGKLLGLTENWHPLVTVLMVMWISAICAAVMNCVSYTAAMVTIVGSFLNATPAFRDSLPLQHLMWWCLALSVCLGANGTMVGAAANMVSAGVADKAGKPISFRGFMHYGIPVSVGCLIASSMYAVARYYLCCRP